MPDGSQIPFEALDARLLPGFQRRRVSTKDGEILTLTAGEGPPVLMLHGDPKTHLCWHEIAPELAKRHTVVLTDLRGRGESHKPDATNHAAYAKRVMAREQVAVMSALGFERFAVVGHDRGAQVARRMALDFPESVTQLCVMDIVPALDLYEAATSDMAQDYFYFFFLTQPAPTPERMIAGASALFMRDLLDGLSVASSSYDDEARALYEASASTALSIAAMCACFRAGFHIDQEHDRADRAAGRRIACPTLVLWGDRGVVGRHFDVPGIWRRWAPAARFQALPCGHFIPEEAPAEALAALTAFL